MSFLKEDIKKLGEQFSNKDRGQLTIATTHTQARYALPRIVTAFKKEFPKVNLVLQEASPSEIVAMLRDGRADIGIATEALQDAPELAACGHHRQRHHEPDLSNRSTLQDQHQGTVRAGRRSDRRG